MLVRDGDRDCRDRGGPDYSTAQRPEPASATMSS